MKPRCQDCGRVHTTVGTPPPDPPDLSGVAPEQLAEAAMAGWHLSTWAATIHWDGAGNTQAWLDGLCERIGRVQRLHERLHKRLLAARPDEEINLAALAELRPEREQP